MAEHARFIRGLLDPTEKQPYKPCKRFRNEFDQLTKEAKAAMDASMPLDRVTEDSLKATQELRDFKTGHPGHTHLQNQVCYHTALGDHVLREANHYLRLLEMFKRAEKAPRTMSALQKASPRLAFQ